MRTSWLSRLSATSAALLTTLCVMTLVSGINAQALETVAPPSTYRALLLQSTGWLRAVLCVDDLFIGAYMTTTALFATRLARHGFAPLHLILLGGGCAAGVLDLMENHHLLTMLQWAQLEQPIPAHEILQRSELSQLKRMLGHVAFVAAGLLLPATRAPMQRILQVSLLFVQLPIGAMTWAVQDPAWSPALLWARYLAFIAGFATIAWLYAGEGEIDTQA